MDRTELRSAFFAEARTDPYAAILTKMLTQMWAEGYRQAEQDLRKNPGAIDRLSYGDLTEKAAEWLTDSQRRDQVEMVIAMAELGSMLPSEMLHVLQKP